MKNSDDDESTMKESGHPKIPLPRSLEYNSVHVQKTTHLL